MKPVISSKILLVFYEVTDACELNCIHCRASASLERSPGELDTEEAKNLILEVSNIHGAVPYLIFTGGNPLMRDDIFDLMAFAKANRLHFSLSPAVTDRLTDDALMEIKKAGASSISVSLDGSSADIHNSIRRYDSYAKTINAIYRAEKIGLPVQVNTTVMKKNAADLPNILNLLLRLSVKIWEVFFLVNTGRGETVENITMEEYHDILDWLAMISPSAISVRTVEGPQINRARIEILGGRKNESEFLADLISGTDKNTLESGMLVQTPKRRTETIFVSSTGKVYPSGFLPVEAGDVRKDSLYNIYRNSRILKDLRNMHTNVKGKCSHCDFSYLCGGSRSRAYAYYGDYLAEDPLCPYPARDEYLTGVSF